VCWNDAGCLLRERARGTTSGSATDSDGLVAARKRERTSRSVTALRDCSGHAGAWTGGTSGHAGDGPGAEQKLQCVTFTLGYSRQDGGGSCVDQKIGTATGLHEAAFQQIGGVPERFFYDRMKTVWPEGRDERGETLWHPGSANSRATRDSRDAVAGRVSRTDERKVGGGREVRAAELSMWLARERDPNA